MNRLLEVFRKKKQENVIENTKMSAAISEWSGMYENRKGYQNPERLHLAQAIASELARLTTLEMTSKISGSKRAEYLDAQYQNVIKKARLFTEYACAKGGVVLKPYIEKGRILLSIIQADDFCPTAFTSDGEISGAIFYDTFRENGFYFTRLEEHSLKNNTLTIKNTAFKSKMSDTIGEEISLKSVSKWESIEPYCKIENIKRPLFSYFKMPMANTIDTTSPLGVSVYSKAVNLIKDANTQYQNLLWEFESGKRALYIDESAVQRDELGNTIIPDKRLYRMLVTDDNTLFEDWSPEFREASILSGFDRILRSIEFNCGLAYGTLSDVQNVDKTAEEIKASKQRSYSTVSDIQNSLKKALLELAEIMDIYCDIYSINPKGEYTVWFDFDDSLIVDRNAELNEKILLLEKQIIKPWELRAWYFNEEEKRAKEMTEDSYEI